MSEKTYLVIPSKTAPGNISSDYYSLFGALYLTFYIQLFMACFPNWKVSASGVGDLAVSFFFFFFPTQFTALKSRAW